MDSFDKEPNIRRPNTKETRREAKNWKACLEKLEEPRTLKRREKSTEKSTKNEDGEKKKTKRSKWRYGKQTIEMIHRTIRETQHSAVETKFRNKMTDAYVRKLIMFQRINQKVQVDNQPIRRDWK